MPELPEVETVRRGLARTIVGLRLEAVELRRQDLRWPIPVAAVRRLRKRTCTTAARRAKYLLLTFDGSHAPTALVHLGMSGRLFVDDAIAAPAWRKHEHWRMRFGDRLLRYVDPRRFGVLDVAAWSTLGSHPLLAALGPEPLGPDFTAGYLYDKTRGRQLATKPLLMDARTVVGVGNIYASEACFRAGVRPGRAAGRLTRPDCARLVTAVREVLEDAIEAGGTTLRDYVGVDEEHGWFQRALAVYDRAGEPCPRCGGTVRRAVLGQRSTYYCSGCQR